MIKKDFKQKYFLYCKDCKAEPLIRKREEQKLREKKIEIKTL